MNKMHPEGKYNPPVPDYQTDSESPDEDRGEQEDGAEVQDQKVPATLHSTQSRRWDQKVKQGKNGKPYKSWKPYKLTLLNVLNKYKGDVHFTRKAMLFCHGVLMPRNIIHYYNSYYRSRVSSDPSRIRKHQKTQRTNLSDSVCNFPAK